MNFTDYLEKRGPSMQELAEMPMSRRCIQAINAFESFVYEEYTVKRIGCPRRKTFRESWELCESVMAFAHMQQDARAAAEKGLVKQ